MESARETNVAAGQAPAYTDPEDGDLFMQGAPMLVEFRLGLLRPGRLHTGRRCLVFVLLTWMPLGVAAGCVAGERDGMLRCRQAP